MENPQSEHDGAWLSPSDALNRFRPPHDLLIGPGNAPSPFVERLRYGIRVAGMGLLIDPDTVCEVIDPQPATPLPNTPDWFAGLINLRGNLLPVFALEQVLGGRSAEPGARRILVIGRGEQSVGVLVDQLPEVPDLTRKLTRQPPVPEALKEHIASAYIADSFVWLDFQHASFFHSLARNMYV